jgi:dTDP-4-dehydrorhamnose 3,5-epimerase
MIISKTKLKNALIIELEEIHDERGFFARNYCKAEFEKNEIRGEIVQCNTSFNKKAATVRGMHFQKPPFEEAKLVRCISGSIYDVIIDLRPTSSSYGKWQGFNLSANNREALYVPKGFAHGFQTLEDNTELFYQMFDYFKSDSMNGLRWNDPSFNIKWPLNISTISEKDNNYSTYKLYSI